MYPEDRVLVGVIKSKRDLNFAMLEHWYRIPQARMPLGIDVEYLAFFLSGRVFGSPSGAVKYYAQRLGVELVRRIDLIPAEATHPRANHLYYRVALGDIVERKPPIVNQTKQVVSFIYTSGIAFERAKQVRDLFFDPEGYRSDGLFKIKDT